MKTSRTKSYMDIRAQYLKMANDINMSISSKRYSYINRVYTNYCINMSKLVCNARTQLTRLEYAGN